MYILYIYIYNNIIYVYIHTILGITQQQLPAFEQRINSFVINPMGNTASDRTCLRPVASGEAKGMLRSTCCAKPLGWTRWGTGLKGKCYRQQHVFSRLQSPMVVLQFLSTKKQEMKHVLLTQDWKGLCTLGMVQWSVDEKSTSVETTIIHYLLWLVVSTPLKNMKVSWDGYFKYMEKIKMFQTTNHYCIPKKNDDYCKHMRKKTSAVCSPWIESHPDWCSFFSEPIQTYSKINEA